MIKTYGCFLLFVCVFTTTLSSGSADYPSTAGGLLQILGYSPSCVAKALAACDSETIKKDEKEKPDYDAVKTALELLKSYSQSIEKLLTIVTERQDYLAVRQPTFPLAESSVPTNKNLESFQPDSKTNLCKDNSTAPKEIIYQGTTPVPIGSRGISCFELQNKGDNYTGVRTIYPQTCCPDKGVEVLCDQDTDGGGWTVFQQRIDNLDGQEREDFFRGWDDYVEGFGNVTEDGEFWIGLENIRDLVEETPSELRIDLEDYEGNKRYALYKDFTLGDNSSVYKMTINRFEGDAGNTFQSKNSGNKFTTKDNDNDAYPGGSCADLYKGGWWYGKCHGANLNGLPYAGKHSSYADGINWETFKGYYYSLKKTGMKVRPKVK